MLSKKSRRPMIGILTGSFLSGNKPVVDFATSPRTHSPRKSFEISSGVGLGIVAALENRRIDFPEPVNSPCRNIERDSPEKDEEEEEEYTIVTRHFPNKACTKVYGRAGDTCPFRIQTGLFQISPEATAMVGPAPDFLSSCHLCRKNLDGEDIYMYRGEKAFCSTECRYREMLMDERREKCGSAVDASSAPRANGSIFSTGILAI